MSIPELTLLIPTYNEEDIVIEALEKIHSALGQNLSSHTEVLIVDDGKDNLPQKVDSAKDRLPFLTVRVLRNTPPLGKGNSLVVGFREAKAPIAGFLDVDLSTPPRYILQAYDILKRGDFDIFIGSRRASGSKVEREQFFVKDILGHMLAVVARAIIFSGMRNYRDTQCGFKFYKTNVAQKLYQNLVAPDGLNDLEILIKANLLGFNVFEQGVEWTDLRESKRSLRRILFGEIKAILHILWKYKVCALLTRRQLKN